jgi:hypothetical protein
MTQRQNGCMSDRLKLAFERASSLSEDQQNSFAEFMLAELDDDLAWQRQFEASLPQLRRLAGEALDEHREGYTRSLDELL